MEKLYKELCELVEKYKQKTEAEAEAIKARRKADWGADALGAEPQSMLKLNCGITVALNDYWEIDENGNEKTEFTFDEALEIEKKTNGQWRVPTVSEWCQICGEISTTLNRDEIVQKLRLAVDEYGNGYYWSGTVNCSILGYGVYFDSGSVYPAYRGGRDGGWPVRLIKGDK